MGRAELLWLAVALGACSLALGQHPKAAAVGARVQSSKPKTVEERVAQYGAAVRARLAPLFGQAGVAYPPREVTLIGLKAERRMEVWAAGADGAWRHVTDYPILGLSGTVGPKLREGDFQAPEGFYRVELLNPNSRYHLSLRVNYPNAHDRLRGREEGRDRLGSDIMIHGKACSVGCLAMGDVAAEDLFVLAAEAGAQRVAIILSPVDFRARGLPEPMPPVPAWTAELYASLRKELARFPRR